jgi:hypothetical protein
LLFLAEKRLDPHAIGAPLSGYREAVRKWVQTGISSHLSEIIGLFAKRRDPKRRRVRFIVRDGIGGCAGSPIEGKEAADFTD